MTNRWTTGTGQILTEVHDPAACQGRHCVIHDPMPGPWSSWPTHWREDRRLMERICPHGIGHPAAEDYHRRDWWDLVHGCDDCPCGPVGPYG